MKPRGFIALMSAILISGVLLILASTGSLMGFYTRADISDTELHNRSESAADACAERAFIRLAGDQTYPGGEKYTLNQLDRCQIGLIATVGTQKIFTTEATSSGKAVTNLRIVYIPSTQTVVSWEEVSR